MAPDESLSGVIVHEAISILSVIFGTRSSRGRHVWVSTEKKTGNAAEFNLQLLQMFPSICAMKELVTRVRNGLLVMSTDDITRRFDGQRNALSSSTCYLNH